MPPPPAHIASVPSRLPSCTHCSICPVTVAMSVAMDQPISPCSNGVKKSTRPTWQIGNDSHGLWLPAKLYGKTASEPISRPASFSAALKPVGNIYAQQNLVLVVVHRNCLWFLQVDISNGVPAADSRS